MIKRILLLPFLLFAHGACATPPETSLKQAFAGQFRVGAAIGGKYLAGDNPEAMQLVAREFNAVTAENHMKWENIHPGKDDYDWALADRLVEFAEAHNMHVTGHVLLWHQQTPAWVFQDGDGGPASREMLLGRLRDHIATVVGRYQGRVDAWEVANEVLNDDGTMRDTLWLELIGADYLDQAFAFAREADPEAHLYINDYNLYLPAKRRGMVRVVSGLLERGVPVDGIGMQGHYGLDNPDLADFEASIEAFAALGGSVHITEMDVSVLPFPDEESRGADISIDLELQERFDPYADGLPSAVAAAQADRYAGLFRVMVEHAEVIERVTFWGVSDGDNWKNDWPMRGRTDYPMLFDREFRRKPVYDAVLRVAREAGDP